MLQIFFFFFFESVHMREWRQEESKAHNQSEALRICMSEITEIPCKNVIRWVKRSGFTNKQQLAKTLNFLSSIGAITQLETSPPCRHETLIVVLEAHVRSCALW